LTYKSLPFNVIIQSYIMPLPDINFIVSIEFYMRGHDFNEKDN